MLITDMRRVIDQVSRDKGIEKEVLVQALEEALRSAARKKLGGKVDLDVVYNHELGEIEVFQFREVVEEVADPELEMPLAEGRQLDPECEIGDSLGTKMDTSLFGRIAAQSAKQVIIQKMKDAERDAVYRNFIDRKGEVINGMVQRFDKQNIIVNLGQAEALLPGRERMPNDNFRRGDRIRAYVLDVRKESHGPQIILTRAHPEFVVALLKTEVPELNEGLVRVADVVREAGGRTKVAVSSIDSDIDPVGACIGINCSRVQNVMDELKGERVDIIDWHPDPAKYVCKAIQPANIIRVIIDEENRTMEVVVEERSLPYAIGKNGQNVRLASRLTKWRLDVKGDEEYSREIKEGYQSLLEIPGVGIAMADALKDNGIYSADDLAQATVTELCARLSGVTEADAGKLIAAAGNYLDEQESLEQAGKGRAGQKEEKDPSGGESGDMVSEEALPEVDEKTAAPASSENGNKAGGAGDDEPKDEAQATEGDPAMMEEHTENTGDTAQTDPVKMDTLAD
ncbi:MAG: transcription termination/antitermination protein NusA [Desulfobacterales bacterium]|nr:MAG: transcription termination/antitermination protein NusA [Desulfobacterales bacterium]